MIFLSSPYSHPVPEIREARYQLACRVTRDLTALRHIVFSPIVHGHPLAERGLPSDWDFWMRSNTEFIVLSERVVVLATDGWKTSRGVRAESGVARILGKPVVYIMPGYYQTLAHDAPRGGRREPASWRPNGR